MNSTHTHNLVGLSFHVKSTLLIYMFMFIKTESIYVEVLDSFAFFIFYGLFVEYFVYLLLFGLLFIVFLGVKDYV